MERSEPSLAPEWLKASSGGSSSSNSSNSSSGNSSIHLGPSSNTEDRGIGSSHRNRLTSSDSDNNIHCGLSFGERTTSSSSRRSTSTNGHVTHGKDNSTHSRSFSFGRSYRDREWNKESDSHDKERLHTVKTANGYHEHIDSPGTGRKDRCSLQRSQSLTARRQNDSWPNKSGNETRNGILSAGNSINSIHKASFDKDFPSLGCEEKSGSPISRANSPNLLPMNGPSTASIGGDGFRSLLVEMPAATVSNGTSLLPARPTSSPVSIALASNNSLNMAETLAQAPLRPRTTPLISVEVQRLEELAFKQSKQLIPVTPKSLVLSTDKSKQKSRGGDVAVLTKAATQVLSQPVNHTTRAVPVRPDVLRTPQIGNFQVLNRDKNGVHPIPKEGTNLSNGSGVKNTHGVRAPGNLNTKIEAKSGVHSTIQNCLLEKKPSPQAQDRNEFFNALRKKASGNNSAANQRSLSATSSASEDSSETTAAGLRSDCLENQSSGLDQVSHNSVTCYNPDLDCNGIEDLERGESEGLIQNDPFVHIDVLEEELPLLLALGWKEDEEVPAITEEEKILFYQMYMARQSSSGAFHAEDIVDSRMMLTEGSDASSESTTSSDSEAEN